MLSVFTVKISRVVFLGFIVGPRFPETAAPWKPAQSIKATPCKSEMRSRFIHFSSIPVLVGLSRFISTVTSCTLLPSGSSTRFNHKWKVSFTPLRPTRGRGPPLPGPITRTQEALADKWTPQTDKSTACTLGPPAPLRVSLASTSKHSKQSSLKTCREPPATISSYGIFNSYKCWLRKETFPRKAIILRQVKSTHAIWLRFCQNFFFFFGRVDWFCFVFVF